MDTMYLLKSGEEPRLVTDLRGMAVPRPPSLTDRSPRTETILQARDESGRIATQRHAGRPLFDYPDSPGWQADWM
mgnify:CR=1 FL=1